MKTASLIFFLLSFLISAPLSAQDRDFKLHTRSTSAIPSKMSYQGVLTDNVGVPKNGTFAMTFGLYSAPTGGSPIWSETQNAVQVTNGIFNVLLGSVNALNSSTFSVAYWLGVQVEGSVLSSRIELAASAYSFWASHADTAQMAQSANSLPNNASLAVRYVSAYNDQVGNAGYFSLDNASSSNKALEVHSTAHGEALYVEAHGDGDALKAKADGSGYAGYFQGNVHVTGNLSAAGTKPFRIDHPLDPANKYLCHFSMESPEVKNIYDGVINLAGNGEATVQLPNYFSALNTGDFRYQLTAIGAAMPNLHVAQEISTNIFRIAGGQPGGKVSWQITAFRNDPYIRDHQPQAEVEKTGDERGNYLYPQGYGITENQGLRYVRTQPVKQSEK
jgi:hypothetical protein